MYSPVFQLSDEEVVRFMEADGECCPSCGGDSLSVQDQEMNHGYVRMELHCESGECDSWFWSRYQLVGVEVEIR